MNIFTVITLDELHVDFLNGLFPPFGNFLLSLLSLIMATVLAGLIGAGTIIQNGFGIKGLTTATTLDDFHDQPVLKNIHESAREMRVGIRHIDSQITTYQSARVLRITVPYSQINHATALTMVEDLKQRINPLEITTSFHGE